MPTPSADLPLDAILGYLNLSAGKPDARFQRNLNTAYGALADASAARPWEALRAALGDRLRDLHDSGAAGLRDASQAGAVLNLAYDDVLPAYRRHHADLLAHRTDAELYTPFFLARVFETVLAEYTDSTRPASDSPEVLVAAVLERLNDFVGYRPSATLETRADAEVYPHERVRPIPLFIRGAGVAWGPCELLVKRALEILAATDRDLLQEAGFDPDQLDELALDPRADDQGHPVYKRPNYVFGEWDPSQVDSRGRYRRFIIRSLLLDALADRLRNPADLSREELLHEEAAVLAGTMLMAAGVTGAGPGAHESTATLAVLRPRIARYRDAFYARLLEKTAGPHGERLRREAAGRQPFAAARQHLNEYLARQRAAQAQQRHIALLYAEMGYADRARTEASRIPSTSCRFLCDIGAALTAGHAAAERGNLPAAGQAAATSDELVHRGVDCGALADPWNVLGFQGLFPLSPAREDSVRDTRIDDLIGAVRDIFALSARVMADASASGSAEEADAVARRLDRLAAWWDRFATTEVSGVPHLKGAQEAASAAHVARTLAAWRESGAASADVGFWKRHVVGLRSPTAYSQVLNALLARSDLRAALALLVSWLSRADEVGLGHGEASFADLARRWLFAALPADAAPEPPQRWDLVRRGFDFLEANAEEYWQVPTLAGEELPQPTPAEDEEDVFGAAYEGVTYRDTTDSSEGTVVGGEGEPGRFVLEELAQGLHERLAFLFAIAGLWHVVAIALLAETEIPESLADAIDSWHSQAREKARQLLRLADEIRAVQVPEPVQASFGATVEYDRRRAVKAGLDQQIVGVACAMWLAASALRGLLPEGVGSAEDGRFPWEVALPRVERALFAGSADDVRMALPEFVERFRSERILSSRADRPDAPEHALRVLSAQGTLRALIGALPRAGLPREAFHLLREARQMEQSAATMRGAVSDFAALFLSAETGILHCFVRSTAGDDELLQSAIQTVATTVFPFWSEYGKALRLSDTEAITPEAWVDVYDFVRRYGRDLFDVRFLTLGNLRGLLQQGVGRYLDRLREDADPLRPVRLVEDLNAGAADRARAERCLATVARVLVENYDAYKDYNLSGAQSDYGDRLTILFDFLRLRAGYDRHAWLSRPFMAAHEVLARAGRERAARTMEETLTLLSGSAAAEHVAALDRLERSHGLRLPSIRARVEERFLDPLAVDRLCALVEPVMAEQPSGGPAFDQFAQLISERARGAGADPTEMPHWLRRLFHEVHQVRERHRQPAATSEPHARLPMRTLTHAELARELECWREPPWPAKPDAGA